MHYLAGAAHPAADNARIGYFYAVALADSGKPEAAIDALEQVPKNHRYDRDSLALLVEIYAGSGNRDEALSYASRSVRLEPDHSASQNEIERLRSLPAAR